MAKYSMSKKSKEQDRKIKQEKILEKEDSDKRINKLTREWDNRNNNRNSWRKIVEDSK